MDKRKLEVRFDLYENGIAYQVLKQIGLPEEKTGGKIQIFSYPTFSIFEDDGFDLYLRGRNKEKDNRVSWAAINERQKHHIINDITNSITAELFGDLASEKKQGDIVKVRDADNSCWLERIFIAELDMPYSGQRYITYNGSCNDIELWAYIKKEKNLFHKKDITCTSGCITYHCIWEEN